MAIPYNYAAAQQAVDDGADVMDWEVDGEALPQEKLPLLDAMKEELSKVKAALHIAMSSNGAEALEARYLAQIKKNKTLTVQLASEKTRNIQIEKALHEEQKKRAELQEEIDKLQKKAQRKAGGGGGGGAASRPLTMMDIVGDLATKKAKEQLGYDSPTISAEGKRRGDAAKADDSAIDSEEELEEVVKSLRERLDRSFKMVAERDSQLSECRKEVQLWRRVVERETGSTKEEVDVLLKKAQTASPGEGGAQRSTAGRGGGDEAQADAGWKGRAQTIILLKGKLRDASEELRQAREREAALRAALDAGSPKPLSCGDPSKRWEDPGRGGGGDDVESLMALVRIADEKGSSAEGATLPSLASPAEGGAGRGDGISKQPKDVDAEARQRLQDMGNKRVQQQREMEKVLRQHQDRLEEEQRKHVALQARFTAVQRESQQLKQHVETILQKSSADDELIAAYKEEILALQEELREMKEWNTELMRDEDEDVGVQDNNNSSSNEKEKERREKILQAERRTRATTSPPQRGTSLPSGGGGTTAFDEDTRHYDSEDREAHERASRQIFFVQLQQHLQVVQGRSTAGQGKGAAAAAQRLYLDFESLTSFVFAYVKALESRSFSRDQQYSRLYKLYQQLYTAAQELVSQQRRKPAGSRGSNAARERELEEGLQQLAALPPLEKTLVQENQQLKDRLRTLSDLLEKSEAARRVWAATRPVQEAEGAGDASGASPCGATSQDSELLVQLERLQRDYNELKKEFNRMQLKRV